MRNLKMNKQLQEVMRQGMNLMYTACKAARGCEGCPFKENDCCNAYTDRQVVPALWVIKDEQNHD